MKRFAEQPSTPAKRVRIVSVCNGPYQVWNQFDLFFEKHGPNVHFKSVQEEFVSLYTRYNLQVPVHVRDAFNRQKTRFLMNQKDNKKKEEEEEKTHDTVTTSSQLITETVIKNVPMLTQSNSSKPLSPPPPPPPPPPSSPSSGNPLDDSNPIEKSQKTFRQKSKEERIALLVHVTWIVGENRLYTMPKDLALDFLQKCFADESIDSIKRAYRTTIGVCKSEYYNMVK